MKKKYLGIDPGTSDLNCAWAVLDGKKLIDFGTIDLRKIRSFPKKLTKIIRDIVDVIDKYEITHMACETYFANFGKARGIVRIPELRGVLQHYADIYDLEWIDVHPSQMKKIVTGKGNAKKGEVMRAVRKRFKLPKTKYPDLTDHEADSIGIVSSAYELSK